MHTLNNTLSASIARQVALLASIPIRRSPTVEQQKQRDDQAAAQHTITTGTRRGDCHHRPVYLGAESNSHPQAHVKEELDMQPAPERHSGTPFNEIKVDLHKHSTCSAYSTSGADSTHRAQRACITSSICSANVPVVHMHSKRAPLVTKEV